MWFQIRGLLRAWGVSLPPRIPVAARWATTAPLEPTLIPKLRIYFCRLPLHIGTGTRTLLGGVDTEHVIRCACYGGVELANMVEDGPQQCRSCRTDRLGEIGVRQVRHGGVPATGCHVAHTRRAECDVSGQPAAAWVEAQAADGERKRMVWRPWYHRNQFRGRLGGRARTRGS